MVMSAKKGNDSLRFLYFSDKKIDNLLSEV